MPADRRGGSGGLPGHPPRPLTARDGPTAAVAGSIPGESDEACADWHRRDHSPAQPPSPRVPRPQLAVGLSGAFIRKYRAR